MGLADLVADVRGQNGTYLVTAKASSDYGAIAANVAVATGKQLAIDLRPGTAFSGIGFTGHIVQAGGAFAGTVQANGSGVAGHIDLSAQGGKQRAVVALAAANTSLPGKAGLTVERALVNADVLMTDQPQIKGDVQLSGTRMGDLYIAIARANVDYHAGAGQAKMLVEGRSKYPFHLAANAALAPQLWRVALQGKVNGVDIASRSPLQIVPDKGTYTLRPATLQVSNGTLQLEGHYGNGMALHSRLNGVDLALVNAFSPGLGVGARPPAVWITRRPPPPPSRRPMCACRSPALPAPRWPPFRSRWTSPWAASLRTQAAMPRRCCAGVGPRSASSSSTLRRCPPKPEAGRRG
jgi:translocation and assembly module TamB